MPGRIKKQSEAEKIEALEQEKELFKAVMVDLQRHITISVALLETLKNLLNKKLNGVYAVNNQRMFSPKSNGKTQINKPVTGSLSQVLSILFLVNSDQNQLFRDMQTDKLTSALLDEVELSKDLLEKFVPRLDELLSNFYSLSKTLNLNLTFVHGKDMSPEQLKELNPKRKSLEKIIREQIKHNELLQQKLSPGFDKNFEQTKPRRSGLGS